MLVYEGFLFIVIWKFLCFYPKVRVLCIFPWVFEILRIFVEIAQKYVKFPKNSEKQWNLAKIR
jgi:hypothetical protein